jgi:hypothetical protein|tara:strand:+ start:2812 stop:2937 length:126 start_codon:yes stop_codon:yes gene_type:complete
MIVISEIERLKPCDLESTWVVEIVEVNLENKDLLVGWVRPV